MSAASALAAQTQPLDDPAAMAMTFFRRSSDLDADDVRRSVQTEGRTRNSTSPARVAAPFVDAASTAVGIWCATSMAKLGPDRTTTARPAPSS